MTLPALAPSPLELPCGLIVSRDGRDIAWANATLGAWLGRPAEALAGPDGLAGLFPGQSDWLARLAAEGAVQEQRVLARHHDGSDLALAVTARRRAGPGSLIDLVLSPARQTQLIEDELQESREELRMLVHESTRHEADAIDRALFAEQIVGIVSHDLRNPLSALHTGIAALARSQPSAAQERILQRMARASERANILVADLLDFTAARLGVGLSARPRAMDLHRTVAEAVEELRLAFDGREILHLREGPGDGMADPDRLGQLLGNLVANAVAYGEPGRPVTVQSRGGAGQALVLSVHNHGQPIAADKLQGLFEPLVRGHAAGDGQARSVGLGLYIVREIARAHGGSVDVASDAERGTRFTVHIPPPAPLAA